MFLEIFNWKLKVYLQIDLFVFCQVLISALIYINVRKNPWIVLKSKSVLINTDSIYTPILYADLTEDLA